jgi:hypothetical protein
MRAHGSSPRRERRRKAALERRDHRKMMWVALPLITQAHRVRAVAELSLDGFLDWLEALKVGRVNCLTCGKPCAVTGPHEPMMLIAAMKAIGGKRVTASMCCSCGLRHPTQQAATARVIEAIEIGCATEGRLWGATHASAGGVQ